MMVLMFKAVNFTDALEKVEYSYETHYSSYKAPSS